MLIWMWGHLNKGYRNLKNQNLTSKNHPMLVKNIMGTYSSGTGNCPVCGNGLFYSNLPGERTMKYCDKCGQEVKWE